MLNYADIFDIKRTSLPISKEKLQKLLFKKTMMGYVQCQYSNLIDTLKNICQAPEFSACLNPNELFNQTNNPFNKAECFIQIEGTSSCDEFVNHVVNGEDDDTFMNFMTYSETFKDEITALKINVIKNYLWNEHNVNNWFEEYSIKLPYSRKQEIISDFDSFKEYVINGNDMPQFIDACDEGNKKKALEVLSHNLVKKLEKYRSELENHINNNTRRESMVVLKKPVVNRIFLLSNFAAQCRKEWPKIQFTALDKRSFESIGLWN